MRERDWRFIGFLCLVAVCACITVLAELVICGKCGYESGEDAQFCGHCGAPLGEGGNASGATVAAINETDGTPLPVKFIDASLVEKDLKKASAYSSRSRWWRALFYSENAMALNLCAEPDDRRKAKISASLKKCRSKLASTSGGVKCETCDGKGRVETPLVVESLRGGTSEYKGMGLTCKVCHGAGKVLSRGSLERQMGSYGKGKRHYAEARQGDGWVPLGDVWIPGELEERLSYKQMATMMRVLSGRCETCLGFGATTCEGCRGTGKIACPDCKTGLTVTMAEGFDGVKDLKMSVKCKTCVGRGWSRCRECRGRRSVSCEECSGIGRTEFCEECHGKGLQKCDECKGRGTVDGAPCKECRGCGQLLCSSCDGSCRS